MKRWTQSDLSKIKTKPQVKMPAISANDLTKQALKVFSLKGYHVWRQNNGGVYDPTKKVFRANSSTPGISDIIGFHKKTGVIIACEIKAGKDKLSDEQELFLLNVQNAGGIGIVVRSSTDLEAFIKTEKV